MLEIQEDFGERKDSLNYYYGEIESRNEKEEFEREREDFWRERWEFQRRLKKKKVGRNGR